MSSKVQTRTLEEICEAATKISRYVPFEVYEGLVNRLGEFYNWLNENTDEQISPLAIVQLFQKRFPEFFDVEKETSHNVRSS